MEDRYAREIIDLLKEHNTLLSHRNEMLDMSLQTQVKGYESAQEHNARMRGQFATLNLLADHPAVHEVLLERARQIAEEDWTTAHDDKHTEGQLAEAAACYAVAPHDIVWPNQEPVWPWHEDWNKTADHPRRKCLVIAAALLVAEIERLDRKSTP